MNSKLICITCPEGCSIEIDLDGQIIRSMTGNACMRGEKYARTEILNPTRIVTTTVALKNGSIQLLPVKTQDPVPKDLTMEVVKEASRLTVTAPIKVGDIIVKDILGTGVDLVATRNVSVSPAEA